MKSVQKGITRRKFFKNVSRGTIGGIFMSKFLPSGIPKAFADIGKSKIVRIHHSGATDGSDEKNDANVIAAVVKEMIDIGIKTFTEK